MAISGNLQRVFVVGPAFRAEDSYTHRHLCEFTCLSAEMKIKGSISEVIDILDPLLVAIFDGVTKTCKTELNAIRMQYPFQPLKYRQKTLVLTFEEGVQMLQEAGVNIDPLGDLNTEAERKLGQLVPEKYDTEVYILHGFPLAVRPFYTMPCHDNLKYSYSFDVYIRGEEIISGGQRIHLPGLLEERAGECGVDVKTISNFIDSQVRVDGDVILCSRQHPQNIADLLLDKKLVVLMIFRRTASVRNHNYKIDTCISIQHQEFIYIRMNISKH